MRIVLLAVGEKPPAWVKSGFSEYARRLPRPFSLDLVEIALGTRGKGRDPARAIVEEGERVLAALPRDAHLVALDQPGKPWDSMALSRQLTAWREAGRDLALAIGGPDGHAPAVLARAQQQWSLGPLTLPHMLVRLIVAEQIYRAWTILQGHPYHRA